MDLKAQFEDAQKRVQTLPKAPPPSDLLELYALYKQATSGDVEGKRPGVLDVKGRAKFDAWAAKKGLGSEAAMTQYVAKVNRLLGK